MPLIDPTEIAEMHEALTPKQRGILRDERCLSDEVIDRYQIGVTMKFGAVRVTIPIGITASGMTGRTRWRR